MEQETQKLKRPVMNEPTIREPHFWEGPLPGDKRAWLALAAMLLALVIAVK